MNGIVKKMMLKRSVLVLILGLAFSAFMYFSLNTASKVTNGGNFVPPHTKIVAFGDSLTAGYDLSPDEAFPAHLQKILLEKGYDAEVINQGISGDTTSSALRRFPHILDMQPDIVILELGANDVLKHQSIDTARENLTFTIEKMKENGIIVLLAGLQSPKYYPIYFSDEDFYSDIAKKTGVTLYPNFMKGIYDKKTVPADLVLPDTVHPSANGAKVIAENITPFVEKTIQAFYSKVRKKNRAEK